MNPFQLGGCLCTPHRRMLFGEGRGWYNQGSFVYLAEACRGWVCAGANGVGCVDVEGRAVLSEH